MSSSINDSLNSAFDPVAHNQKTKTDRREKRRCENNEGNEKQACSTVPLSNRWECVGGDGDLVHVYHEGAGSRSGTHLTHGRT
jgi:hypothetical protein